MSKRFDVLGIGCTTVDDFLYIDRFPTADDKTEVTRSSRQCGGLTATALVAASKLGAKCAYGGVLGTNDLSKFVLAILEKENIDTSLVSYENTASPIHSTVIVGDRGETRNIFFEISGKTGPSDDLPTADDIRSARVLFLDHYGAIGGIRASEIARQANIPIVADFERDNILHFAKLSGLVDHLILSESFALKNTAAKTASEAVDLLWNRERSLVAVTCGSNGCWYRDSTLERPVHQPAFLVDVVDSTGCGDVFHGAYAAALARGAGSGERITFASAAAAIKAQTAGGQTGIPKLTEVESFLKTYR
jgi:sulfofructose kinase